MATKDLDQDRARAAGVAVPPSSKQDYLDRVADPRTNFRATADADDPQIGRTAVRGFGADPQELPGQVYAPSQLPDPANAVAAGFPPIQIPEHLILESDEEVHPQGPEPSERAIIRERQELRADLVERAEQAQAEAEEDKDEDANPSQGTSQVPAGGTPGDATQSGEGSDGTGTVTDAPETPAGETPDQPAEEETSNSSSSSSRRGRGSRSRS